MKKTDEVIIMLPPALAEALGRVAGRLGKQADTFVLEVLTLIASNEEYLDNIIMDLAENEQKEPFEKAWKEVLEESDKNSATSRTPKSKNTGKSLGSRDQGKRKKVS